jgi:hypothetical protein
MKLKSMKLKFIIKDLHVSNMFCQTSISNNNIDILEWEHEDEIEEHEIKVICCYGFSCFWHVSIKHEEARYCMETL